MPTKITYELTCDNCGYHTKKENPELGEVAGLNWWRLSTEKESYTLCSHKCVGQFKP